MKRSAFAILFLLFLTTGTQGQIALLGFDQPFCGSPLSLTYTFANYSPGGGSSALHGYKIYRNGVEVHYNPGGSMSSSHSCLDLIFMNDSTGFAIVGVGGMQTKVTKTSDYGVTWTNIGGTAPGYLGLYVVNANFAYLVTSPGSSYLYVARCSDLAPPNSTFILDNSINADVYRADTIFGNSLCNIDSLNIFVKNSAGDTIDYHINLFYMPVPPVGINEISLKEDAFIIYPNPSKNEIIVKGDPFKKAEIYDLRGSKIAESISGTINIESLAKGAYLIKVTSPNGHIHTSKFVKE